MTRAERLAAKLRAIDQHLARVDAMRQATRSDLAPMTDACDAVVLHLWHAVPLAIDVAVAECVARGLGSPADHGTAFRALSDAAVLEGPFTERLVRAVGFRNVVAHGDEGLDLDQVWLAACEGPDDLRAFAQAVLASAP